MVHQELLLQALLKFAHQLLYHISCLTGDDVFRKFWEIKDSPLSEASLSPKEQSAVQHFKTNYLHTKNGNIIVPLPKKKNVEPLGELRLQAVRRFLSPEHTLHGRSQFEEFGKVMKEYFDLMNWCPLRI